MEKAYVSVCGVPTEVITWGSSVSAPLDPAVKELVICITGNPGVPEYYTKWAKNLYSYLEERVPVWVIGHLGHSDPPHGDVPPLKGNESLYDLDAQIRHKVEFIQKYVPADVKIQLVGHSIGAWMILQLLRDQDIKHRLEKCYLLFPTVERMVDSPNGWIFTKIALPLYTFLGAFFTLFNSLPAAVRIFLIRVYFWFAAIPDGFIDATLKYTKPPVMEKVVFLANDEMARVRELQSELVRENVKLLKFYYGTTDGWVPVSYFRQLRERLPDVDAVLDTKKIDHAFVLRQSEEMAAIVGDMINRRDL